MASEVALECSNVTFAAGATKILSGLSLRVLKGECLGIIGPNGSGKTTMFNCISGFQRIQSGEISLLGRSIVNLSAAERARAGLGRVFQSSGVFREMTLEENLLVALEQHRSLFSVTGEGALRKRARELLAEVGLGARGAEKAGNLSGGQLRLLEIVRMVATGAQLLLLDEPTAGVSPKMKGELIQVIARLREQGSTIMVIEHDMAFIEGLSSRVAVLDQGQVVLEGSPTQVRADPRLHEIYFGTGATPVHSPQ